MLPVRCSGGTNVISQATRIAEHLRAAAPAEADGISEALLVSLHQSGILRPLTRVNRYLVVEALAMGDASIAWVVMVHQAACDIARLLPVSGQQELLKARHSHLLAGSGSDQGVGHRAEQGYRVSGTWRYGSGSDRAEHISVLFCGC